MKNNLFILMLFMIYASSFSACANDEKINKGDNYNDEVIEKNINEDTRLNENIVEENEDIISIDEVISDIDENGEILEIMPAKYDYTHNIDLSVAIIDELSRENPNDNITFSETSLNVLLGMLYEGASGETKEGISSYLMDEYSFNNDEDIVTKYEGLMKNYDNKKDIEISLANSFWTNNIEGIKESYIESLKNNFDAGIEELDMTKMEAVDTINNWCGEKTNNRIKSIVNYDDINNSENILINALYFNADWAETFDSNNSIEEEFNNIDNTVSNVIMMNGRTNGYFENDYATGFSKYYEDNKTVYIAILPKKTGIYELNDLDLNSFLESYSETDVNISIPKYKSETGMQLQEILKKQGLNNIFESNADFSEMSYSPIYVDKIIQKTFIDVNELGTEAAAITSANLSRASLIEEIKEVKLNRSFSYLIYDIENNEILFMGKINKL